jgi:hypothetical protein
LPIWLEFMQSALSGAPEVEFANVVPLEQEAHDHTIHVDTPDTAPTEDEPTERKAKPPAATSPPPAKTAATSAATTQDGTSPRP